MGFFVLMKLLALRMWPLMQTTCLFMSPSEKITNIGKVTPYLARSRKPSCPVSITERIIKVLSQSNSSHPLVPRIVRSKSGEYFHASMGVSISTLTEEFKKYIQPFESTARIVWGLVQRRTPFASAYRAIYWICVLGGGVLPRRTDTLKIQLKIVWAFQNRFCSAKGILYASLQFIVI